MTRILAFGIAAALAVTLVPQGSSPAEARKAMKSKSNAGVTTNKLKNRGKGDTRWEHSQYDFSGGSGSGSFSSTATGKNSTGKNQQKAGKFLTSPLWGW